MIFFLSKKEHIFLDVSCRFLLKMANRIIQIFLRDMWCLGRCWSQVSWLMVSVLVHPRGFRWEAVQRQNWMWSWGQQAADLTEKLSRSRKSRLEGAMPRGCGGEERRSRRNHSRNNSSINSIELFRGFKEITVLFYLILFYIALLKIS